MLEVRVLDEPVTIVVSAKGWVRARGGHGHDAATLEIRSLDNARAARARKGKAADLGFKPTGITRVE